MKTQRCPVLSSVVFAVFVASALASTQEASAKPGWLENFAEAQKLSKEEGKPLLLDFTGSDWCGFCIRLDREVFSKAAFRDFAEKNFVLMEVDYPRNKPQTPALVAQNERLDRQFKIQSYPTLVVLSPTGKVLKRWEEVPADLLRELKDLVPGKGDSKESPAASTKDRKK